MYSSTGLAAFEFHSSIISLRAFTLEWAASLLHQHVGLEAAQFIFIHPDCSAPLYWKCWAIQPNLWHNGVHSWVGKIRLIPKTTHLLNHSSFEQISVDHPLYIRHSARLEALVLHYVYCYMERQIIKWATVMWCEMCYYVCHRCYRGTYCTKKNKKQKPQNIIIPSTYALDGPFCLTWDLPEAVTPFLLPKLATSSQLVPSA